MTDIQVLGLHEPFSPEELKRAYREKSKFFHPDRNEDNLKNHLAMIRLNLAYSNLKSQLKNKTPGIEERKSDDNAYSIYKEGIQIFQSIHPSKWKAFSMNIKTAGGAIHTHPAATEIIKNLIREMAEAYHRFSLIASEHENSPWYADSLLKMKELEKMTLRYVKIKESYEAEQK